MSILEQFPAVPDLEMRHQFLGWVERDRPKLHSRKRCWDIFAAERGTSPAFSRHLRRELADSLSTRRWAVPVRDQVVKSILPVFPFHLALASDVHSTPKPIGFFFCVFVAKRESALRSKSTTRGRLFKVFLRVRSQSFLSTRLHPKPSLRASARHTVSAQAIRSQARHVIVLFDHPAKPSSSQSE